MLSMANITVQHARCKMHKNLYHISPTPPLMHPILLLFIHRMIHWDLYGSYAKHDALESLSDIPHTWLMHFYFFLGYSDALSYVSYAKYAKVRHLSQVYKTLLMHFLFQSDAHRYVSYVWQIGTFITYPTSIFITYPHLWRTGGPKCIVIHFWRKWNANAENENVWICFASCKI